MEIYLTFDDGIHPGTEEVLSVLKETGVKATFFLVGAQFVYSFKKDSSKCLRLLRDIYENHKIGHHSYSHANYYYTSYYQEDGVQIDNRGTRRSVVQDFEKGREQINDYLNFVCQGNSSGDFFTKGTETIPLARFPGRNTWFLFKHGTDRNNLTHQNSYFRHEKDTSERALELFKAGYQIFGWDIEWEMTFDFHDDALAEKNKKIEAGSLNYLQDEDTHPYFDMYTDHNLGKDRLTENWEVVKNKILGAAIRNKVIVLMHDRAFRKGFANYDKHNNTTTNIDRDTYSESDKLKSLIEFLRGENFVFKTLGEYIE